MPPSGTSIPPVSLLYVDDEPALLEICRIFLEKSGDISVSTCESADQAIEILASQVFDAIISDYQMPGMDGLRFLQHLRSKGVETPFIIFTGKGREDVVIEALNSGADFYLQKGGDPKSQFAELRNKIMYAVARRRSEMKVAHSHDLMKYIIEHNNASVAVHDSNMDYIFVSQRYVETYGVRDIDIIGKNHYEVFPDLPEKWREIHRKVLAGEGVFSADDDPYPREDGSLDWTRWECRPWFEADGTIGGLIVYTEIITERKLREEEILRKNEELAAAEEELRSQLEEIITTRDQLEETNEYLENLISHANAPIIVWDQRGRITRFNDASGKLTGIPPQEAIGRDLSILFPPERRVESMDLIQRAMAGEMWDVVEIPIQHQSGEVRTVIWNSANIRGSDGEAIIATIAQGQDITERKYTELVLLQKNEELAAAEEEMRSQLEELIATHNALEESNEYLNSLISYANAPIIVWDPDYTITRVNHAFEDLIGVPADGLVGEKIPGFFPEDSRDEWMALINTAMEGERLDAVEMPIMHQSGAVRSVIWNSAAIMQRDGTTLRSVIAQGQDITERKAAEERLKTYLRRESDIINFLPDATFAIDTGGVVIAWNRAMEEMTGVPAEEMIGKGNYEYALPFYHERRPLLIDLALRDDPDIEARYPYVKREGDKVFSEITIPHLREGEGAALWFTASLLYDEEGNIAGAIESIRDITERKAAEERLKTYLRRESDIINFLPDATFAIDIDGVVIAWNRAMEEMTGVPAEKMIGKGNYEYALPIYHERRPILIDLALRDDPDIEARYPYVRREGDKVFSENTIPHFRGGEGASIWFTASLLYDEEGNVAGAIESIRDITERKAADAALKESESRFRELAELLPQAVYETDISGTLTYANNMAYEMFGYSEEDVDLGMNVLSTISPEYREKARENFIKVVKGEQLDEPIREYLAVRKDGTTFPINIYSSLIIKDGRVAGVRGIIIDITEQKKLEEELQKSRNRYKSLVSNVPGVVYRCLLDPDWTMLYLNEDIEEISGYPSGDFIRNRKRTYESIIHPDDSGYVSVSIEEAVRQERSWAIEYRICSRDGDIRWVYENGRAAIDGDEDTRVLDGIIIDITDRKKAEEKVRTEQAFINTLLATSPAFFVAVGEDGTILKMNDALLTALEYEERDLIGKDYLSAMVPEEEYEYLAGIFSQIMNNEEATTNQNHIISRTGRRLLVEWHGRRAYAGDLAKPFVVGVGIDITDRKRAEDSLREANRKLNLLSSITRHDILNKIMTIKGYLEVAEEIEKDQELAGYLHELKNAADAIERQIEFTRQYDQIAVHDPAWTSLSNLIQGIDDSVLPISFDCEPVLLYAEPMIEKVFTNLYDNAIRHAEGATGIAVHCQETDSGLLITWEDDGIGIPIDQKEKIFESGFGKHTGFGLFLVREILEITGMRISETGVPGAGARFEILVPKGGFEYPPELDGQNPD